MPYKVLMDEVNVLKKVGEFKTLDGKVIGYDHDSILYMKDDVISEDDVSPVVQQSYADGDAHTRSILVRVDKKGHPIDEVPVSAEKVEEEPPIIVSKDKEAQGIVDTKEAKGPHTPKKGTEPE